MKIKLFVQILTRGAKKLFALVIASALLCSAPSGHAASATELLEKGIYTEETKGDLAAAIAIYRQIAEDQGADASLIAQAQMRIGLCELKLGHKPQAISALERLTQEFPDKDQLLAVLEQHMPQLLDEIIQQIERNYIGKVDGGELMETAIRAIVGKLDAHGGFPGSNDLEFLSTNELTMANETIEQKLAGIGAVLKVEGGEIAVQTPLAGSPALDGGLRAGDHIVAIDGVALPAQPQMASVVKLLRGPVGTPVSVGIRRAGTEELLDFKLVRDTIRLPSVLGHARQPDNSWNFMLDETRKIGFIRLTYLGRQSTEEMRAALSDLTARGMKGLILDLRNNPGGLLDAAVAVSDLFVESGRILTVKGRDGETVYDAKRKGTFSGTPIALLVNRKTASAAEIIAACLQDHGRAVVIGERTFGQGIVRSLLQLKSGVGAVKLPVATYYRPSGKSVHRYPDSKDSDDWGVRPDAGYDVVMTGEELKQYESEQSARDALYENQPPRRPFTDRQLQSAVDYLVAQLARPK